MNTDSMHNLEVLNKYFPYESYFVTVTVDSPHSDVVYDGNYNIEVIQDPEYIGARRIVFPWKGDGFVFQFYNTQCNTMDYDAINKILTIQGTSNVNVHIHY
jgi:hypothetical protein